MGNNSTSEEKLLNLIRKKDREKSAENRELKGEGDVNESEENFSGSDEKFFDFLKLFNNLLAVFVIGIICFIGYRNFYNKGKFIGYNPGLIDPVNGEENNAERSTDITLPERDIPSEIKEPFSYYEGIISQRDIFEHPWEKVKEQEKKPERKKVKVKVKAVEPPRPPKKKPVPLDKKIRIVGIVLDENPQVIIEDLKTRQTFFVFKGDKISDAVVDEIKEDNVTFIYDGEKVELGQ